MWNMDSGDPLTWFPLWEIPVVFILRYPFALSGNNAGRISMWSLGYIKNFINDLMHLIPCVTQNMTNGAWNKWGAQMVFYTTSLKGLTNLYDAASSLWYGMASNLPILGWGAGNIAGLLKLVVDICMLLVF